MAVSMNIGAQGATPAFFLKAFKAEEGTSLAAEIAGAVALAGRRVVIIDHPPTVGLLPLIEGLEAAGAEVHLRDHHADADRDGQTVTAVRARLGERAVITTRAAHPACSGLITAGEFAGDVIVADADQDGVTAALKAAGVFYPGMDEDAAVLDGPVSGKTVDRLSPVGFLFVRAWGALPAFGAPGRDHVFKDVVTSFAQCAEAAMGQAERPDRLARLILEERMKPLERLAEEYERKVEAAKALAERAVLLAPGLRFLDATGAGDFDPPTLATELDRGVLVSVRKVGTGPIAGKPGGFGAQVSLARTKDGEAAGLNLAALVPADWARGPEAGCISNTPFLLHLSPQRWEEFRSLLLAALPG